MIPLCHIRLFLMGLVVAPILSACVDRALESEKDGSPLGTVLKLNRNVNGLRKVAEACMNADSVAVFDIEYNDDGSVLYWLRMKEGGDLELYSEIVSEEILVPELSMAQVGDSFYWTVNNVFLIDSNGDRVSVTDMSKPVSFVLQDESIHCKVLNTIAGEYPVTRADYLAKDVMVEFNSDTGGFDLSLSSGFSASFPSISEFRFFDEKVRNRSFYKDVFLDAGVAMTSRKTLAAAEYLGLSLEGISFPYSGASNKDRELQCEIVGGYYEDVNGRLLYPDGQPRYKMLFVNGGESTAHGKSLGEEGLESMRAFVRNGGSYVGTCAGAFLAAKGYDDISDCPYYLSIWPGVVQHTKLNKSVTGLYIEDASPLLRYYDFGGDMYVDSVRHNSGGYPLEFPDGTEILARYKFPARKYLHKQPNIWAYKQFPQTGRVIMCGSHPEEVPDGERRDLTAAMMLYALDGVGVVSLKGFLKNGVARVMDKMTSDNIPAYTRIGDLQTHHFAVYFPSDVKNVRVEVNSTSDCDFALMMNRKTYAFPDSADYRAAVPGARQQLSFSTIQEGFWFIGVQCLTTVTVTETDYGQAYSGKTEVLNGVPYQIMVSWD